MVITAHKPPYAIPSMADIEALPKSGYKLVSTFSGCGGGCLGFKMAGFETVYANEFVPAAQDTYRANFPGVPLDARDIREVRPEEVLEMSGLERGDADVMEGSPPCASFSMAGSRQKGWAKVKKYSDTAQRVDDLFFEYVRLVDGMRPKVFVAENVAGLIRGKAKGYFKEILKALKACGYLVSAKVLDAQWLGVPQARQRVVFVGVRQDLGLAPAFPKPMTYRYSLMEALPTIDREEVKRVTVRTGASFRRVESELGQPMNTIGATDPEQIRYEVDISRYAIAKEWDKLAPGETSDRYFNLSKPDKNKPCPTVTQKGGDVTAASVTHHTERRKFYISELKRICSFPDDFVLTGTYARQWERLGRSVPPLMMRAVAEVVRDEVLDHA